ncbi:MAG: NUDIX domain-containing protein [Candidatus Hodarchaeales archaeon]|jgi:hypothetical protein
MDGLRFSIKKLLQNCSVLGTGFIPSTQKEWWFAVGNKKYWKKLENGQLMISFTAIGGHVERNESFIEAILREIKEETGSHAIIEESEETYYVNAQLIEEDIFDFKIDSIEKVIISDTPKPWIIYSLKRESDNLGVVVYRGELKEDFFPNAEVPALIYLPPDLLNKCPISLEKLLDAGAKIKEQDEAIPRKAFIYPFGSMKIVQELLNKDKN